MIFNSLDFAWFLPLTFLIYWVIGPERRTAQNYLLLGGSYLFYGWWSPWFLLLILASTITDYWIGKAMVHTDGPRRRRTLLWLSLGVNLGMLGYFKYANFFLDSFVNAFTFFGANFSADRLDIVLPVGISFYTFQTLSYTIDIYRKQLEPATKFVNFAAYVSFFPQLVAGPIERARDLLPQFQLRREFNYPQAVLGLRQVLWGLFKKMVVADNCALVANQVFADPSAYPGSTLAIGVVLFGIQIYADFSGYSDIAIGTARLFGFEFRRNFRFPYFARGFRDFWQRWHISLTTWFRDYVYIPLGGNRAGMAWTAINTIIVFLISGLWHGARWTFVVWGLMHALLLLPGILLGRPRLPPPLDGTPRSLTSRLKTIAYILFTFTVITLTWVLFRAESFSDAAIYYGGLFSASLFGVPKGISLALAAKALAVAGLLLSIEWVARDQEFGLAGPIVQLPRPVRWVTYSFLTLLIGLFAVSQETPFIYFQF